MDSDSDNQASQFCSSQDAPDDRFRFLVASDIHLGYNEKDPVRGNDSFNSFEEVLCVAVENQVDFLLLGGDLFHENKPSAKAMKRCVELLRKYCLGSREIPFAVVSDQKLNFNHGEFSHVNYEDDNLKISLPVFSIHGNHDDPIGKEPLGALDTLGAVGLVNYFGKYVNMERINVQPLLLKKGNHRLALYGLGSLPEERLHRLFLHERIKFVEPQDPEKWFKIFVVHQNRVPHGTKYLPENLLGDLPDMVIWGHEHEARTSMEFNPGRKFYVYQPGSTVATSLCPAEAFPKHVGLLTIYHDEIEDSNRFKLHPIPLKTTRRLLFEDISLEDALPDNLNPEKASDIVFETIAEKINELLDKAEMDHSGDPTEPTQPLIRLRVACSSEYHHLNPSVFAHRFKDKVANPKDLVLFKNKRLRVDKNQGDIDVGGLDDLMEGETEGVTRCNIEDVIVEYFENTDEKSKLTLLSERLMIHSIREIVDKDQSTDKISEVIEYQLKRIDKALSSQDLPLEDKSFVKAAIKDVKEQLIKDEEKIARDLKNLFKKATQTASQSTTSVSRRNSSPSEVTIENDSSDSSIDISPSPKRPARGRGRGRGAKRGRN